MKNAFFLLTILVSATVVQGQIQKEVMPRSKTADGVALLPASLDAFLPPRTDQPLYLFRMLEMNKPFAGIVVDFFEGDIENAIANFEKFKIQYLEVSKLVPEWDGYFPLEPVTALGAALKTGDPKSVMAAVQQVGKACSDCHIPNLPKVQHKYFWGDFQGIRITDPVTEQEMNNQQLMRSIDASFTGIEVDVEQGQIENAHRQFQDFRARFEAMEEMCMNCHDTERHYYVDESIKAMLDKLGQELGASPVDPNMVSRLSQEIGMESCFKCHLVHLPAAASQRQMAR